MNAKIPPPNKELAREPTPPSARPLGGHPDVLVEWRWVEPAEYTGDSPHDPRLVYRRVVVADGHDDDVREALRELRRRGLYDGPLKGDELEPEAGATKRGIPADYAGDDEHLCNAKTGSGRPCRALALPSGRCRWHGGMSTGPRTEEGKRRSAANLAKARAALAAKRRAVP